MLAVARSISLEARLVYPHCTHHAVTGRNTRPAPVVPSKGRGWRGMELPGDAAMPLPVTPLAVTTLPVTTVDAPSRQHGADGSYPSGRSAAENDEMWRATKAAALSIVEEEAAARTTKTERLRILRLTRTGQPAGDSRQGETRANAGSSIRRRLRWGRLASGDPNKDRVGFDDDAYPGVPVARVCECAKASKGERWFWTMPLLEHGVLRSDSCSGHARTKSEAKAKAEGCYQKARADWQEQRIS